MEPVRLDKHDMQHEAQGLDLCLKCSMKPKGLIDNMTFQEPNAHIHPRSPYSCKKTKIDQKAMQNSFIKRESDILRVEDRGS